VPHISFARAVAVLLPLAIVLVFLPVLTVPYGLTDDYRFLALSENLGLSVPPHAKGAVHATAAEGRPVHGLLVKAAFSAAETIDNLRFVRIITVAGIAVLALLLNWALVRSGVGRVPAALIALLVCTLPSFQVFAAWTVSLPMPWTALLGGCASLLTAAAVDAPRHLKLDRFVGATALLVVALMTYQPTAMFFWVFLAVVLVGTVADSDRGWRLARAHFAVAAAAAAIAYLGYKVCVWLVGPDAPGVQRGGFTHDAAGKAEWFWHWALYGSLNLFDLTWSAWLAAFVATVAAGGIVLWLLRNASRPLLYIALGVVLLPLTVLPNLVVEETYEFEVYRTLVALSALIALYFGLGALALWLTFREWLEGRVGRRIVLTGERVATAVAVVFVATCAVQASRNVDALIADPQLRELQLLRGQVASFPDPLQNVNFVLSGFAERVPGTPISDEFGYPSTSPWYAAEPLVLLLLREQGRLASPPPGVSVLTASTTPTPGTGVIDLNGRLGTR
jgi:hypothetical protein